MWYRGDPLANPLLTSHSTVEDLSHTQLLPPASKSVPSFTFEDDLGDNDDDNEDDAKPGKANHVEAGESSDNEELADYEVH